MYRRKGLDSKISCVTVILTEEQQDIIDEIRKRVRKASGARLSQSEVIRAAVNYTRCLDVSFENVRDEHTLLDAIIKASQRNR